MGPMDEPTIILSKLEGKLEHKQAETLARKLTQWTRKVHRVVARHGQWTVMVARQ